MKPYTLYNATRAAIITVATAGAIAGMTGYGSTPPPLVMPQFGVTVEGHQPGNFNPASQLDPSEVGTRTAIHHGRNAR